MQPRGRKQVTVVGGIAALAVAVSLSACSSSPSSPSGGSSPTAAPLTGTLNGSGSSFQTVFQQSAISQFKSVQPGMTVNYGSGGSGKGRSDLASNVVNYAGSDSPIPSTEASNFTGKTVLYFPVLIGPITMSYNLPGVSNLKLTPTIIANIFQGNITKWNDPAIAAVNSGASLPASPITIAVRSDSSGTTANFSLFLQTAVASVWKLGSSSTISWPHTAKAASGNSGVAQVVKSTPGAIGYVDYADAKASGLSYASVQNSSGNYISPSSASASASAAGVTVNPDLTFHAVWGSGAQAYPITYQSWVLVYAKQSSANVAKMLQAYIGYLLGDGQKLLPSLGYAALPASIDQMAKAQLSKITG
jgi:phosphate transport system substrate-binding protein